MNNIFLEKAVWEIMKIIKVIWDLVYATLLSLSVFPIWYIYFFMTETIWEYIADNTFETGLPIIKEFSLICLTFFGISLIGGIFNPKEKENNKFNRIDRVKQSLLLVSLMFLTAFVMLQFTYIKVFKTIGIPVETIQPEIEEIIFLFKGGLSFYVLGIIFLFIILIEADQ